MTSASYRAAPDPGHSGTTAAALLAGLRIAHANLRSAMEVMREITDRPGSTPSSSCDARWRLSQASFKRRKVWVDCLKHLRPLVGPGDLAILESLRLADMELQRYSGAHVERWRLESVKHDWSAYCDASCAIRARMCEAVELEKRLLYPLLARCSAGRRSSRLLA